MAVKDSRLRHFYMLLWSKNSSLRLFKPTRFSYGGSKIMLLKERLSLTNFYILPKWCKSVVR